MLHRLCKPPSIPLGFNLAVVVPRRLISRLSSLSENKTKKISRINNTHKHTRKQSHTQIHLSHRQSSKKNVKTPKCTKKSKNIPKQWRVNNPPKKTTLNSSSELIFFNRQFNLRRQDKFHENSKKNCNQCKSIFCITFFSFFVF